MPTVHLILCKQPYRARQMCLKLNNLYSGDLNSELVQYSDHGDFFRFSNGWLFRWPVPWQFDIQINTWLSDQYSEHHLNTRLLFRSRCRANSSWLAWIRWRLQWEASSRLANRTSPGWDKWRLLYEDCTTWGKSLRILFRSSRSDKWNWKKEKYSER